MESKVLQHRNNAMRMRALITRFRSPIRKCDDSPVQIYRRPKRAIQPIRKFDGRLIKIYRRPKPNSLDALPLRPNDHYPIASLLLLIFFTYPIDRASAERSFTEVLEVSKKLFPDYHDRKTTKCICSGYWKIVLVNDVDHFIGLERECESQQKIMGPNSPDALALRPNDYYPIVSLLLQIFVTHPIDRASAERSFTEVLEVSKKLFPDYHDRKTTVRTLTYPTYVSRCLTLRA
ncbi:hypothetical protein T01_14646 [Trichinella spiralis]|uniref:Uncharacterized protein n=1 Tax=Trichinella spiralis TaxID=6334 RepID=A0A0V1B8Q6_TRISP|nr:hypothetical protein T01_14646 [Trichinella spiralis]